MIDQQVERSGLPVQLDCCHLEPELVTLDHHLHKTFLPVFLQPACGSAVCKGLFRKRWFAASARFFGLIGIISEKKVKRHRRV